MVLAVCSFIHPSICQINVGAALALSPSVPNRCKLLAFGRRLLGLWQVHSMISSELVPTALWSTVIKFPS